MTQKPFRVLRMAVSSFVFSLAKAPRPPRTSMFDLFLPQNLCVLCVSARLYLFFLSQRRRGRRELRCLICSYPKTSACSASLREFIYFFLSQRRRGRRELLCLFCSCTEYLCGLYVLAREMSLTAHTKTSLCESL